MEDVRQLVQEEGREARNLVAFHVAVDTPAARISRKPPRALASAPRRGAPRPARRSASAGRDKRSELRARYWALLFGDLQRSIGEIYNTVEAHENLNECQEVILVLENYTRDFKALCEWFRLKWEYDNTPPPQRPQSLAWEIRKTDFVRPESRKAYSVKSSPSVSGKNSPCLSGHNTPSGKHSPSLTGKASPSSGKISPRFPGHSSTSPKANVEFFSNKIASKVSSKPEPKAAKEGQRLSDIKEKEVAETINDNKKIPKIVVKDDKTEKPVSIQIGKAKEFPNVSPKQVVAKSIKQRDSVAIVKKDSCQEVSSQAKATIAKLDEMENEFLAKQITNNGAKSENNINESKENEEKINNKVDVKTEENTPVVIKKDSSTESPTKSEDNFGDVSNDSSAKSNDEPESINKSCDSIIENTIETKIEQQKSEEKDNKDSDKVKQADASNTSEITNIPDKSAEPAKVIPTKSKEVKQEQEVKKVEGKTTVDAKPNPRPAYSQAAAKPKPVAPKVDVKTPVKSTPLTRSKTVVEMRPNTVPKTQRPFQRKSQTNKCSYPFNLTTGRTSLFDANQSVKGPVQKKPTNRSVSMASGDAKTVTSKVDSKQRVTRPTTLKINETGDKVEKVNPAFEKIKDCEDYSSSDTIVTQIDMSRIESSESLRTLVPEEMLLFDDVGNSIEVLNVDDKSDNEGWLTVKSRRLNRESKKQKSHWANRFNQPSATTSLPTLNVLESPKQEVKAIVEAKPIVEPESAKPEQIQHKEPARTVKIVLTKQSKKEAAIIRQKSDVTGLKTRSSRSKALNKKSKEKSKESELTKNRLHSSLESLTTGLERSQESTEETFDFDKWRFEFKTTFKYLDDEDHIQGQNELLKTADPSEASEIAEMTSQIEENERKISWALDLQSEVDQRKLCEQEDLLHRQILELQEVSDIDLDTETDDTETDAEILLEDAPGCTAGPLGACLEERYENELAGMSWAERVHTLSALQALVARDPGRAQQLHAKLSQGIKRRGSIQDALRRLQAKQARAERQRQKYQTERAKKIHQLLAKVEEVKVAKNQLIEEKRLRMERRLQKAAENRDQHLKDIVRKAHDEEEKLREIAFIKQLEAENRRHDFLEQCRSLTTRLKEMRRERLNKLEQKAVREAGVIRRRRALELARAVRGQQLLERRRARDSLVQLRRDTYRQQRGDACREKAEGVRSRLSALAAAAELEADALRCRIRHKQNASQQRLQSHLQAIREKATGPRQPTLSESQDQNALTIEEEAAIIEQERREREKTKAVRKKARKIKQKLLSCSAEFTNIEQNAAAADQLSNPTVSKMNKVITQITNMLTPLLEGDKVDNKQNNVPNGIDKKTKDIANGDVDNGKSKKRKSMDVDKDVINEDNTQGTNTPKEIDSHAYTNKKKNKKRNKDSESDKPKLSKASSICSSISDLSKTSTKNERPKVEIDVASLERQLNELHRTMERLEKKMTGQVIYQKLLGLKAVELVLSAADKEQLSTQLTVKCLTTAISTIYMACSSCLRSASFLVSTNCCTYMAALLTSCMEKDLSEPRESELAKQLCDCLTLALDSVLVATRAYQEKDMDEAEGKGVATMRCRAHAVISYLCLSGCISTSECAGEVRDNVQTLLTVFAELCQPCTVDIVSERTAAAQALRSVLGTSLCGFRSDFCVQWSGAESGGVSRAATSASLMRALAEFNPIIVQESFGEGGWALEFRAAVGRLLTQYAPNDGEQTHNVPSSNKLEHALKEELVLDLITLVGFVVVNNNQLQETICDNWSVIKTLCTLPANWLVSPRQSSVLLPTLVALAQYKPARDSIQSQLSLQMLDEYLNSPEAQDVKLVQVIKQGRNNKTGKKT